MSKADVSSFVDLIFKAVAQKNSPSGILKIDVHSLSLVMITVKVTCGFYFGPKWQKSRFRSQETAM